MNSTQHTSTQAIDFTSILDYTGETPFVFKPFNQEAFYGNYSPLLHDEAISVSVSSTQTDINTTTHKVSFNQGNLILFGDTAKRQQKYYLNIEFARIIKLKDNDQLIGFSLSKKGIIHSFKLNDLEQHNLLIKFLRKLDSYVIRPLTHNNFKITKLLGKGGQASVFRVLKIKKNSDSYQQYAFKVLYKKKISDKNKLNIQSEISIQRELSCCENIVKIMKLYESHSSFCILLDYQEGGTLLSLARKKNIFLSEHDVKIISIQLLLAADLMRLKGILHQDLKPENILLHSKDRGKFDIRIADSGFSTIFDKGQKQESIYGTPGYMPPEIFRNQPLSYKSDIFGIGTIIYLLLTGSRLFKAKDPHQALRLNRACDLGPAQAELIYFSREAQDLILLLLSKDPQNRPTATEALKHPWFYNKKVQIRYLLKENQQFVKQDYSGSYSGYPYKSNNQKNNNYQSRVLSFSTAKKCAEQLEQTKHQKTYDNSPMSNKQQASYRILTLERKPCNYYEILTNGKQFQKLVDQQSQGCQLKQHNISKQVFQISQNINQQHSYEESKEISQNDNLINEGEHTHQTRTKKVKNYNSKRESQSQIMVAAFLNQNQNAQNQDYNSDCNNNDDKKEQEEQEESPCELFSSIDFNDMICDISDKPEEDEDKIQIPETIYEITMTALNQPKNCRFLILDS